MSRRKPERPHVASALSSPQSKVSGSDQFGSSLPSTPLRIVENVPSKQTQILMSRMDLHKQRHKLMARIKSLNKLDIRSPILGRNAGAFGLSPLVTRDDQTSLYTTRTTRSMALRLLSFVPSAARSYYNDFTTLDWAKAYITNNKFYYDVHHGKRGKEDEFAGQSELAQTHALSVYWRLYYDIGKWVLIVVVAFFFALIAYFIDKTEVLLVGLKHGYCHTNWLASEVSCCRRASARGRRGMRPEALCSDWISWSSYVDDAPLGNLLVEYVIYVFLTVLLAYLAGRITLTTKIQGRLTNRSVLTLVDLASSFDTSENDFSLNTQKSDDQDEESHSLTFFTAAGSGVPEVKTILSGFVIRRFLGTYTLFAKTIALVFAIASGMALGKEGPYVHLATCVGNIASRLFPYINENEYLKKEVLTACALSGVALAFGSPLGGMLFILEEINNYLPSTQLFLIFFSAITSTLFLKFLNPYGTGKTVLFELHYESEWRATELPFFVVIGIAGGIFGAIFIRFTQWWPKTFRQTRLIKDHPLVEIVAISLLTGLVTFWNPYTKRDSSELVLDLATSCSAQSLDSSLCPVDEQQFITEIQRLFWAFLIKVVLTFVTFGIKAPCGIYVPSMVCGALFGRLFAMCIQWTASRLAESLSSLVSVICLLDSASCVDLGIYSMISAGAFMAGVTRMNITLVTILFELTSSYTYVLPIAIAIAVANWMGGLIEENSLYECLLEANDYPFMSPERDTVDPYTTTDDLLSSLAMYPGSVSLSLSESKNSSLVEIHESGLLDLENNALASVSELVSRPQMSKYNRLYIDISHSPYVSSAQLQRKLVLLAESSLLDGCIALVKDSVCVGTIYFAELEFCLDKLQEFCLECNLAEVLYCKVHETDDYHGHLWMSHRGHNDRVLDEGLELRRLSNCSGQSDYFNYGSNSEYLDFALDRIALKEQMDDLCTLTSHVDKSFISISHNSPLPLAHLIFDRIGTRIVILQRKGKYYGVLHKKVFVDYCRRPQH